MQGPAQTVALKEEAIPHTAISNCTSHFFLVNTLGEVRFGLFHRATSVVPLESLKSKLARLSWS